MRLGEVLLPGDAVGGHDRGPRASSLEPEPATQDALRERHLQAGRGGRVSLPGEAPRGTGAARPTPRRGRELRQQGTTVPQLARLTG